jgi:hypothetical protein
MSSNHRGICRYRHLTCFEMPDFLRMSRSRLFNDRGGLQFPFKKFPGENEAGILVIQG